MKYNSLCEHGCIFCRTNVTESQLKYWKFVYGNEVKAKNSIKSLGSPCTE